LGKYEVTNSQYRRFRSGHDSRDYKGDSVNGDAQPAVYVSWQEAGQYAQFMTRENGGRYRFRLPTEAEWEYACRAGTRTARYWGESPDRACGFANVADQTAKRRWPGWTTHNCDDGYAVSAPVGSFRPNAFGLYDMLGNVWEWVQDTYDEDAYLSHSRINPSHTGGSFRVLRGGGWGNEAAYVRCADRSRSAPVYTNFFMGFRLARTP
jgi:formylglycine-generating enzyme required for sulfatase activity